MKKLFFILLIFVLLINVSFITSADKIYDKDKDKIILDDNGDLYEYILNYNTLFCTDFCYAEGTINLTKNAYVFDKIFFKDKQNSTKNITYDFFVYQNGTKIDYLKDYKEKSKKLDKGVYDWRLEGTKDKREDVDWVINMLGFNFTEWAWWLS